MPETKTPEGSKTNISWETVLKVVGALVLLFGAYHGLISFLDHRIEKQLSQAELLEELARRVRPSVVFDGNGSILADMGAMEEYVQRIEVVEISDEVTQVIVTPSKFLGIEPVLESLDGHYIIRGERGQGYQWVFHLRDGGVLLSSEALPIEKQRFRLEVLR